MSADPHQSSQEARTERHLGVLDLLITQGADLATRLHQQVASADETHLITPEVVASFERISRSVRRTILLARELAEPLPQPRPAPDRTAARKRIIRGVEDAINLKQRTHGVDVEPLEAELLDRLDRPDIEHDLATRPVEDIIADIARDLGVGFPADDPLRVWKRRTPEDIEQLEARAAAPLPAEPRPPRTATRAPPPKRIELPKDAAAAVAMVLAMGKASKP